ncbi:MAG: copper amine oxidase N-terminal domain-containing protein [Defluviitaleaceae bacterium]|nr:copper amine oxidase N-terminal domain-containing protein [Defluviitaleaceae bacterium]
MRKKILAGLLALTMAVAPAAAVAAQTVTVPTENVLGAIHQISLGTYQGQTFLPLRATVEAFGADVDWNVATNTAIITVNGAELQTVINSVLGTTGSFVRPGNFTLELTYDRSAPTHHGRLVVANGPFAGTRVNAQMINDRIMLPVEAVAGGPLSPADFVGFLNAGLSGVATSLVNEAVRSATGLSGTPSFSFTPAGLTITIN